MELKDIKQQFFTYRNGMLADRLREVGDCHKVIFGLNLPQIVDIARMAGIDKALSEQLWANDTTRESRLIAPMLYPLEQFQISTAREWIESVECVEVADILCHRLLRYLDYAWQLCQEFSNAESDLCRYTALRLAANLDALGSIADPARLRHIAELELSRNCTLTAALANAILTE